MTEYRSFVAKQVLHWVYQMTEEDKVGHVSYLATHGQQRH